MELIVLVAAIPILTVLGLLMIVALFWIEMRRMALASGQADTEADQRQ
ncbi:hypothetical protein [Antrihabitans sp. YC2-6]|nr:hypothetical protein [Antrihabitans sp. YC2-6]MBJ8348313.1 hypothetical protein [Antrihabitans sp. YC2-6]